MKKLLRLSLVGGVSLLFLTACTEKTSDTTEAVSDSTAASSIETEDSELTSASSLQDTTGFREIVGTSGQTYQLALPDDWQEVANFQSINPDNDFMLSNDAQTAYLAAVVETKTDFTDFDAYLTLVKANLSSSFEVEPTFTELSSLKGQVADFSAAVEGINAHYLYYVIETDSNYVQLYGWTLESMYNDTKDELATIMDSFQEVSE